MKFIEEDILTIDNEDFLVASKLVENNETYVLLIKIDKDENLSEEYDIVKEETIDNDTKLVEITNDELFASLCEKFFNQYH